MAKYGFVSPELQLVDLAAPVRHAIRGLTALADHPGVFIDAAAIARRFGLPAAALAKCFQKLARRGLLESHRGPRGGYRLRCEPGTLTLAAVASAVGETPERRCLLASRPCGHEPCAMHETVMAAETRLRDMLGSLTLRDLARAPRRKTS